MVTQPYLKPLVARREDRGNAIKLSGDIKFISQALSPNPSPCGRGVRGEGSE